MSADLLRQYAVEQAAKLKTLEEGLDREIELLEKIMEPFARKLSRLKHRSQWCGVARQKLQELAGVCDATPTDEIPF